MAGLYIIAALIVIFANFNQLLPVLEMVFQSAFTGKAAVGGFAGATVMAAMRLGIARGVFSNESVLVLPYSLLLLPRLKSLLNNGLIRYSTGSPSSILLSFVRLLDLLFS